MPSNTVINTDDTHLHENRKDDPPGHDVVQARTDGSSIVSTTNQNGNNSVISADDQSKIHNNAHGDHSVEQIRAGGDHIVVVTTPNGTNTVVHSDDGSHLHENTHGAHLSGADGWFV